MKQARNAAVLLIALATGLVTMSTAQAQDLPGPPESYLFTVDSPQMTLKPGKGEAATLVITEPNAIRWSDRPYRHERDMAIREMLAEFGWDARTHRLAKDTPNASVSIGGHSQIVDIRKAVRHPDRLVLSVRGIAGRVTPGAGPGSVVIDNVTTYPSTQKYIVDSETSCYLSVTATSSTSVTVTSHTRGLPTASVTLTPTSHSATLAGPLLQSVVEASGPLTPSSDVATLAGPVPQRGAPAMVPRGATIGTTTYTAEAGFSAEGILVNLYRPTTGGTLLVSTLNF